MSLWTSLRDTVQAGLSSVVGAVAGPGAGSMVASLSSKGSQQLLGMQPTAAASDPFSGLTGILEAGANAISGTASANPIFVNAAGIAARGVTGMNYATAMGAAIGAGMSGLRRIGNIVYSQAGKILHVIVGSTKVTPAKAAILAKRVGFDAAAAALGIGLVELAQMVFSHEEKKSKHRTRGITGADIRRTSHTMRKLHSLNRLLGACHTTSHHRAAPRTCKR